MARVTGNVLGNLSGKLGNLSARTVEGQTILSARPSTVTVSQSTAAVEARNKFAVTGSFAKYILAIPTLESIWSKVKISGMSVFNTVFKNNYPYCSSERPTSDNKLTPGGFNVPVQTATLAADSLALEIDMLNSAAVFSADEVNLDIVGLVVYYNPTDENDAPYSIIKLSKSIESFDFANAYTGSLSLDVVQQNTASKYQNSIVLLAVASKTSDGKVVQYSDTYAS